ncbi:hypothetical protein Pcinc_025404 [Petrolisthes cinctipes]|uniref:Zinc finger PHD-type domain-containing protein n=1 Tax=Petrolisthes cinctipes TaxID=88211 RepID=A0AAE1F825_PETCI|nr:hypothetical protein Pcinc_025404 [Petrolisthes cinctipes]
MEKLLPSKTVTPVNQNCGKCSEEIDSPAFRCEQCKLYIHVGCSSLPSYSAIKYFTSRVHYVCEKCESSVEKYDDLVEWIESLGIATDHQKIISEDQTTKRPDNQITTESALKQLDVVLEAVNEIRQKIHHIIPIRESSVAEKLMYSDVVRSPPPDTVQHVIVKPKDSNQQPSKEAVSAALKTVPITKITTNNTGHLKITLPHLKAKSAALEALSASEDVASSHEVAPVSKILPKITICSIPSDIADEDVKQCVMNKNPLVSDLIAAGETFEVLFSKTPVNGFKVTVVRVSPLVREVIMQTSALYIENVRCRTYDRYWVNRCSRCQRFGHVKAVCRAPEPKCGHCAGTHLSPECLSTTVEKCCNCMASSRTEVGHKAFSTKCPEFIAAREATIKKTMTMSDVMPKN